MKLTVPQFRAIQANFALLVSGHQRDLSAINKSLNGFVDPPEGVDFSRAVNTRWNAGFTAKGLLFRYREKDEVFSANLVLHDNRQPTSHLHIEHSSKEIMPTLISLHYYHRKQDTIETAQYLWAGTIQAASDFPDYDYTRVKPDSPFLQLVGAYYVLNHSIDHLPFAEGKKLAVVTPLKQAGITYIGELIQKGAEEVERILGEDGLRIVRETLAGWKLSLGTYLPYWRAPQ